MRVCAPRTRGWGTHERRAGSFVTRPCPRARDLWVAHDASQANVASRSLAPDFPVARGSTGFASSSPSMPAAVYALLPSPAPTSHPVAVAPCRGRCCARDGRSGRRHADGRPLPLRPGRPAGTMLSVPPCLNLPGLRCTPAGGDSQFGDRMSPCVKPPGWARRRPRCQRCSFSSGCPR